MIPYYYFIPVDLEADFASQMEAYRAAHPTEYTNTSAYYENDGQPFQSGNCLVIGTNIDGSTETYPKSVYGDIEQTIVENVQGFFLEGYVKEKDPNGYLALINQPGVIEERWADVFLQRVKDR